MTTYRLDELRTRLEEMTGIENDTYFSTNEKNRYIAAAATDTWDKVVSSGMSERYVKNVSFNTVSGQTEYDLTSASIIPAQDFYKIHQVYVNEGSNQFRPLPRIEPNEIQNFRPPTSAVPIKFYYIPTPPTFKSAGVFSDSATIELPDGMDEHLLNGAAIMVRTKQEDDYRKFAMAKQELEGRLAFMGNTDWSAPARVVRRRYTRENFWYPYNQVLTAYAVRGQKLELYYSFPFVP